MKPTQSLLAVGPWRPFRKLPLTTKDINKGYYKGTRTGAMGRHTKWGGYRIDYSKVRTFVVPSNLEDFKLTPFITKAFQPVYTQYSGHAAGPKSPELYLDRWKTENGFD